MTLAQPSCASPTPAARRGASPPPYEDLARHYAPVIRQGAITNQDYITAVDFDGDWVGSGNSVVHDEGLAGQAAFMKRLDEEFPALIEGIAARAKEFTLCWPLVRKTKRQVSSMAGR